jgi:molecular chaperone HscA
MVAGAARILVAFEVDADGLLNVTAFEQGSGVRARVEVKPSYGLTDGEIESMLRDSMAHARDDMAARRLREQRVESMRTVEALRAAMSKDGDALLDADERARIQDALSTLEQSAAGDDPEAIEAANAALEKTCEVYVERRMNRSIHDAMAGRRIEEFE